MCHVTALENPKFKFDQLDFQFLISQHRSPTQSFIWKLPDIPDLYLFILFLKQNISTHLGIHSIRIQADENRLIPGHKSSADEQTQQRSQSIHRSTTPAAIGGSDDPNGAHSTSNTMKTFRVKISSDDITFVYFPLPRVRSKSHRKRSQRPPINGTTTLTTSILMDPTRTDSNTLGLGPGSESEQSTSTTTTNTTQYTVNTMCTNHTVRRRSSALSQQSQHQSHRFISPMHSLSNLDSSMTCTTTVPSQRTALSGNGNTGDAHHSFEESSMHSHNDENVIYKLGASFGSGLAILKCGVVTGDDHNKLSYATTCINRTKTNDLTAMTIKSHHHPHHSSHYRLQDTVSMVESIIAAEPKCLDPPKGGHLTSWKSPTAEKMMERIKSLKTMKKARVRDRTTKTMKDNTVDIVDTMEAHTMEVHNMESKVGFNRNTPNMSTPTGSPKNSVSPIPSDPVPSLPLESDRKMLRMMPSNSSFLGSASPPEFDHDDHEDGYAATFSDGEDAEADHDTADSNDSENSNDCDHMELEPVSKATEQRSFAIELWSRPDTEIKAEALSSKFNEAIKQSMYEYAVEWIALLFQNERRKLIPLSPSNEVVNPKLVFEVIQCQVIEPILKIMDHSVTMSSMISIHDDHPQPAPLSGFKSKSCHRFKYSLPSMLGILHKVAHSVVMEVSTMIPSIPIVVMSKEGDEYRVETKQRFIALQETNRKRVVFDQCPADSKYVILGGIRIFEEETKSNRRPRLRRSSASENYKMYGPKQLFSIRSTLHRHCLFIALIEYDGLTVYHYNWNLDKVHRFQMRMDKLMGILDQRSYTLQSLMLEQMGLSSPLHSLVPPMNANCVGRKPPDPLRVSQSAGSMPPPPPSQFESMESSLTFESLWNSSQHFLTQYREDGLHGIGGHHGLVGTPKRMLYQIGMTANSENIENVESVDEDEHEEYLSHSPPLSPTPATSKSFRSHSICSTAVPIANMVHLPATTDAVTRALDKKRKLEKVQNGNIAPQMKRDPMEVHFAVMEQRTNESLRSTERLKEISKIILRAKYLNELVADNRNPYWKRKMEHVLRCCLLIHEVRCPFLIECREDPSNLINQISSVFIMELSQFLESQIVTLRRLIDALVYTFKLDSVTRQILIVFTLNIHEVVASFYLVPETPHSCSLNREVAETHSLLAQHNVLRNVLEDLEQTMSSHLGLFVSRWCTQFVVQKLMEEFQCLSKSEPIRQKQNAQSLSTLNDDQRHRSNRGVLGKGRSTSSRVRSATSVDCRKSREWNRDGDGEQSLVTEVDWLRAMRGLNLELTQLSVHDRNRCSFMRFEIAIDPVVKYVDKERIAEMEPLWQWFGRYGFEVIPHHLRSSSGIAFIASSDHSFHFHGARFSKKLFHSKVVGTAVIVLVVGDEMIEAYFMENVPGNVIHFGDRRTLQNDSNIIKYLNAPNVSQSAQSASSSSSFARSVETPPTTAPHFATHQLVVSSSHTPKLMATPHRIRSRSSSPTLPAPRVFSLSNVAPPSELQERQPSVPSTVLRMKSVSADALISLNESMGSPQISISMLSKESESNEVDNDERQHIALTEQSPDIEEEKMAHPLLSVEVSPLRGSLHLDSSEKMQSLSLVDLTANTGVHRDRRHRTSAAVNATNDNNDDAQMVPSTKVSTRRRWSFSENVQCDLEDDGSGSAVTDSEVKGMLTANFMEGQFTGMVRQIVSEWYKSPYVRECEETFQMIVDCIQLNLQRSPSAAMSSSRKRSRCTEKIKYSKLKRMRKYFWRKSLKEVVRSHLADSKNAEAALLTILCDLEDAVICGNSAVSLPKYVDFCTRSDKVGNFSHLIHLADSSAVHFVVLLRQSGGLTQQQKHREFLIHFHLKEQQQHKSGYGDSDGGARGRGKGKGMKLVMEVIGREEPQQHAINRQMLNDLVELTSAFVRKWKRQKQHQ